MKTRIEIPEVALVAVFGRPRRGPVATLLEQCFSPAEVQFAGNGFDELTSRVAARLTRGELTAVSVEGWPPADRQRLAALARHGYCEAIALIDGPMPATLSEAQLRREGFRAIHVLRPAAAAATAAAVPAAREVEIRRVPLGCNRKSETGPFDLIGDVHGCAPELRALLGKLGWHCTRLAAPTALWGNECWLPPGAARRAVFVGDLVDRGPAILDTLRIVRNMMQVGVALGVMGNHDDKLVRWLEGRSVQTGQGLESSIAELEPLSLEDRSEIRSFLATLADHYVFDAGRLVVAHAGLIEAMQGRSAAAVRAFCLYGETNGATDEYGLPARGNWAEHYRGAATVIYGHTPVAEPQWLHNTLNIDTGVVYGRRLTALRYLERELVSVQAQRPYAANIRPIR